MGTAQVQGALWGARAREWADLQERAFGPMYEAAFDAADVHPGTNMLDVGCGAGLALSLARARGADVSGIDAAPELVEIARSRCVGCDIRVGELEELPFADESFDVVTGFNSFQYAADRVHGLEEARRVLNTDGRLIALVWGSPDKCEMAAYLAALSSLMPAPPPGAPGPWALSPPGALEQVGNPMAHVIPSARLLAACEQSAAVQRLLMRYAQSLNVQAALTAASNAHYALPERLARWLLMCHDRTDSDRIELTHEFLAMMLAVRRSGVTVTLHTLEATGAIRSARGMVMIANRGRLEEIAGDAYGQAEAEYRRLIGPFGRGRHGMAAVQ